MKKLLSILFMLIAFFFTTQIVRALTFSEGYNQTTAKPMLLLVYAPWSSGQESIRQNFLALQKVYSGKLNFVLMDISKPDTKEFNKKFHINPNLPYVMMFRGGGKVNRVVETDCATNLSCLSGKVRSFIL